LGSFVVFLNDDETVGAKIKELAENAGIQRTVLGLDRARGPKGYKLSEGADITVVLYTKHEVKANHAFAKGELGNDDIDVIVADLAKIFSSE
jgi:hypothetical protein